MLSAHAIRFYFSELASNGCFFEFRYNLIACLPHPPTDAEIWILASRKIAEFRSGIPDPDRYPL